jgi:hypothetical protein
MAERADTRRRIAVYLVAVIAASATIATSPPHVESRVQSSSNATIRLDSISPRAVGRFVLNLSPEVLPVRTSSGPSPSGTVTFTPDMRDAGAPTTGDAIPVLISVSAVGITDRPTVDGSVSSWPVELLCRLAEPCRREFEVTAEWLRPEAGRTIEVPVSANLWILYDRWESPPPGASASWEAGEFVAALASPTLPTTIDLGAMTLGRDAPMAARHVGLTASADLLADPSRTDLTAYVRAEVVSDRRPPAIVTLVADPLPGQNQDPLPQPSAVPAGTFVAPFIGCAKGKECSRGFTVFARWQGLDVNQTVDIAWSFDAVARFPGASEIPAGASLTAKIDKKVDLDASFPRLRGQLQGSFDLGAPAQDRRRGSVRLRIDSPAFRDQFLGSPPPAVALVRVRAAVKDTSEPASLILWVSSAQHPGVESVPVPDDGSAATAVVFPLADCRSGDSCTGYLEITVESSVAHEATISWEVDGYLPLPDRRAPSGVLGMTIQEPR